MAASLKSFYSQKERLFYHPRENISGFKWHNRLFSFDDRFVTVKKNLDSLIKLSTRKKLLLLDIGVGDAVYESILEKESLKRLEVYGVDISEKQLKRAKNYLKEGIAIDLNNKDLPYKKNYFDLVLISEILEHVFSPDKVLKEGIRVLKPGGYLVLTFPNSAALQLRLALLVTGGSPLLNYPENKEHIRFFNFKDILKMTGGELKIIQRLGLSSFLFDKWNFGFKVPMPRFTQILGNQILPDLALGNLVIFKK